jgi:hypothetical protein
MTLDHPMIGSRREEEWQELQTVLQSGFLEKAPNLRRFLEYVAEQYFAGKTEQLKEYSIAVQALHRNEQFDPQSDTIVRVTAHTLRKKLEQYYATEGAEHLIQIRLPAGKYVLQFKRREEIFSPSADLHVTSPPLEELAPTIPERRRYGKAIWSVLAVAGIALQLLLLGSNLSKHQRAGAPGRLDGLTPTTQANRRIESAEPAAAAAEDSAIRVRFGETSNSYIDVAGHAWRADQYCIGGTTFSHLNRRIQGTDDPALFQSGREGKFQCKIPAPPGIYRLLLLFADTAGDKEAARQVDFSINNTVTAALDVVDEAGSDDAVVGKVYAGIHPMSDRAIHLDFTSDGSFVNAAEFIPSASDGGAPLRMLAGPASFRDDQGNTWLPERFFQGGRRSFHPDDLPKIANSRLFEWERYGHFRYSIPVVAGKEYRVKLYFSEGWFGKSNGGPGGVGSRMFDVYCDGMTLLKDFDILREQKDGAAIVTFNHVKPTAHGMLDLDFVPVKNYPLINAIEIDPED